MTVPKIPPSRETYELGPVLNHGARVPIVSIFFHLNGVQLLHSYAKNALS